ncbi:MAG: precorrin-3B C(17)-methyltransferase [Syntrophobacteraceae bacterium]
MRSKRPLECRSPETAGDETEIGKLHPGNRPGKLSIVSLGPGDRSYLAQEAQDALRSAEIILGYKTYLDLIPDLTQGKTVISSGMRKEMERCQTAIDHALAGQAVALVSSGDAGIYGMAGLVLDICKQKELAVLEWNGETKNSEADFFLQIIPGIPAFNAAASLAGAPLMHDFAAVSLSDHLTPWNVIEKRLTASAQADFVLAIYNPRSKSRPDLLEKARQILLRYRAAATPAAIIRRAMREGQWKTVTTLELLPVHEVDMQSIVIVGNSQTYIWRGWMVTPRGYLQKYALGQA